MKVAINGFGRIGRQVFKVLFQKYPEIEVVAINDLSDNKTLAHLLKYDSNYGIFDTEITSGSDSITVNGSKIKVLEEKEPANLPWREMGVDVVIESTGFFTDADMAKAHIEAGAKKVLISAPAINADITIVLGVNEDKYNKEKHHIISNASCTTNSLAPIVKVLVDSFGVKQGLMTTVHSYTNDQKILDLPHEDLRRARAAALNIIPTSTGAAKALKEVIPEVDGILDGMSLRVPTPVVSVTDLVVELDKNTTKEEITAKMKEAEKGRMKGYLQVTDESLVSMDLKGNPHSSIYDSQLTKNIGGNFFKIIGWYDNEWGYSNRLADLTNFIMQ
ncbi:type I glyceraldehyde-3-phosphate dehydrogenase [candidate division WS5 bacterium]|uniref:Glyceraldehyde-3-phosphate dehydrogenase n=1 Tax=candidate division WS5 bacterium TaxID=2093353 RepID=A0A419DFY4_9BACT|nr:MAG: type I glyceraldehyde-3-phosphate dehydrogenase [candidate division WS5 bacterium]